MVLQVLRDHKFYANLRKGIFYEKLIHYLGDFISEDELTVDPEKIEAIRGWSMPRNVIEFKYYMGLAGFYRRFIQGF
jgi:hypothetical protein